MSTSPIADLSYRGYDGPLDKAGSRWMTIAKNLIMQAFKKRVYWVLVGLSGWYYFIMFVVVFITEKVISGATGAMGGNNRAGEGAERLLKTIIWKDQFINGYNFGQMLFMIIALYVAAGAIANDSRSNALLVYLSKPCTKMDYLVGKWVGALVALFVAMAIPATIYYALGALGYNRYGFFSDPWLFPKVLLGMLAGAAIHASLALGFSAVFKQGRMAGATYAGLYLLAGMFSGLMVGGWTAISEDGSSSKMSAMKPVFERLSSCSVDGILVGIFKRILGSDGSKPLWMQGPSEVLPSPPLVFSLGVSGVVVAIAWLIMWNRVRAVEVVRG